MPEDKKGKVMRKMDEDGTEKYAPQLRPRRDDPAIRSVKVVQAQHVRTQGQMARLPIL